MTSDEKKQIKEAQPPLKQDSSETVPMQQPKVSQYFGKYNEHTSKSKQFVKSLTDYQASLSYWDQNRQFIQTDLQLMIKEQSINRQIILLEAFWGIQSMAIRVLNIKQNLLEAKQTKIWFQKQLGKGQNGSVYLGQIKSQTFAVKCLPFPKISRKKAVEEYFLSSICSKIGVGPKIRRYFAFDLLMFEDCSVFAMEKCEPISEQTFKKQHLFDAMAAMHTLNIVHQDIKCENIMYSPTFDQLVFIDFGLSTYIQQMPGEKTQTTFVGTFDYVTDQMKKIFRPRKEKPAVGAVDLYYNDLHCLLMSIQRCKQQIKISYLSDDSDNQQIYQGSTYLRELNLLFLLYDGYRDLSKEIWQQIMWQLAENAKKRVDPEQYITNNQSRMYSTILQFIEELVPTSQLFSFLNQILPASFIDTERYQRIKTTYEITQKTLCGRQFFYNEKKHQSFNNICQELEILQNLKQKFQIIIFDKMIGTLIPQIHYWVVYLEYINFMNNKFKVDSRQRFQAAKAYFRLFYNQEPTADLEGRCLISFTIVHCLECLLIIKQNRLVKKEIQYLLLQIYNFLVILDCGDMRKYQDWIERIYSHWSFDDYHKLAFLCSVSNWNILNKFRMTSRRDTSRMQFVIFIDNWYKKKSVQLQFMQIQDQTLRQKRPSYYKQNRIVQNILIMEKERLSNQFQSKGKYLKCLFNTHYYLHSQTKYNVIMFNWGELFRHSYNTQQDPQNCKQLVKIWHDNIQDPNIQSQFIFDFLLESWPIKQKNRPVSLEELTYVNDYCLQIQTNNLYLIMEILKQMDPQTITKQSIEIQILVTNKLFNYDKQQRNNQIYLYPKEQAFPKFDYSFIYTETGFLNRAFDSSLAIFYKEACKSSQHHLCRYIQLVVENYFYSHKIINAREQQLIHLIQNSLPHLSVVCSNCTNFMRKIVKYSAMKRIFEQIDTNLQQITSMTEDKYIDKLRQAGSIFMELVLPYWNLQCRQTFLYHQKILLTLTAQTVAIFCISIRGAQKLCNGVYNYYKFLFELIESAQAYFTLRQQDFIMTDAIAYFYPELLPNLISTLSQYIESTLDTTGAKILVWDFKKALQRLQNHKSSQYHLFQALRNNKKKSSYVVLFHCELLLKIQGQNRQKKVLKEIIYLNDKIHFKFRRIMSFYIYHFSLKFFKGKGPRYRKHYIKLLVKQAMIDHRTQPDERKHNKVDPLKNRLIQKLQKFEKYKCLFDQKTFKFNESKIKKQEIQKQKMVQIDFYQVV